MVRTSEGSGSMSEFKRDRKDYHMVGKCVPKKDSNQLLLGKPVFMDDIQCLLRVDIQKPDSFLPSFWNGIKKFTACMSHYSKSVPDIQELL